MTRPLTGPAAEPGDERAVPIADDETERRVLRAVLAAGGSGHPQRAAFVGDPSVRQRWIADGGEAACFGRLVLLGEDAYLGDVLTLPAYRRRGHAAALCRRLLDDARENGADHCVLAATPMARGLYAGLGFADAMEIVGFQSGVPAAG